MYFDECNYHDSLQACLIEEILQYEKKKMIAVHFTTVPCETYKAHELQAWAIFAIFCPCGNGIVYQARFKDVRAILHVFLWALFKSSCAKN